MSELTEDQAKPMRQGEELDLAALRAYLEREVTGSTTSPLGDCT